MNAFLYKIIEMSISASILVILVLLVRVFIIRKSSFVMKFVFILLMASLLIPISVQSPLSIHNILNYNSSSSPFAVQEYIEEMNAAEDQRIADAVSVNTSTIDQSNIASNNNAPRAYVIESSESQSNRTVFDMKLWIVGVILILLFFLLNNLHFAIQLRKNRLYDDDTFTQIFLECKKQLGIKRKINVIVSSGVSTAAVYGIFNPKILISPLEFEKLSVEDKRYILIHELLHIKHHDTLITFISYMVNILHWFNPILWFAFSIMRKDIELMCDMKVLSEVGYHKNHDYASTLFRLIKASSHKSSLLIPKLSITDDKKRRISMILKTKKSTLINVLIALVLVLTIVIVGCTKSIAEDIIMPDPIPIWDKEKATEIKPADADNEEYGVLMASYTLPYTLDNNVYTSNAQKACALINGRIIRHDQVLSINDIFEPYTQGNGWIEGTEKDNLGFEYNGFFGICDVTSALNYCANMAELKTSGTTTLRHTESLPLDEDPLLNFRTGENLYVSNSYEQDILIIAFCQDETIMIEIYGLKRKYSVGFETSLVTQRKSRVYETIYNAKKLPNGESIAEGEEIVVVTSYPYV
ncbi:MAG: VanW family protein, partial [Clostridiales bacterium]|nr:VanW family protein [Clostridiales bacterium]